MNNIDSKVYTDISIIISMMSTKMREKISKGFINFIEKNKDINYNSSINPKVPLNKQNIDKETKEMLGIIYRDYLCDNEKRIELLHKEKNELTKYEEQQRELYNPDDIFKKMNSDQKNLNTELNVENSNALIKHKESLFSKFKNCIFRIFHINE